MTDIFEEVEEQLRSDRYNTLARQAAPWVTGIFAVVLLGYFAYWGFTIYQNRNLAAAPPAASNLERRTPYTLPELIDIAQTNNPTTRNAWNDARDAAR